MGRAVALRWEVEEGAAMAARKRAQASLGVAVGRGADVESGAAVAWTLAEV